MSNKPTHFAIHIDDIKRAKIFYDGVFNWGFNSYGQDDFLQIKADKSENGEWFGAKQSRKYLPVPDKIIGFECTRLHGQVFRHRRKFDLRNAI